MPTKAMIQATLAHNRALNARTHLLTYDVPADIAAACRPGQFVNVRALDSTAPLLRRPISICDARPDDGQIDLLVQKIGEGTRQIASRNPGAVVDMIGPLGTVFQTNPARPALMIAGGVGVAPLYFLTRRLHADNPDNPPTVTFCYGARSADDFVLLDRIEDTEAVLALATEDGSRGAKGYVTDIAEEQMTTDTDIFVCGPSPMMNAALRLMRGRGVEGQLSLENMMGCGVGACQGCVVPTRQGHLRVCHEGPVVPSELLDRVLTD